MEDITQCLSYVKSHKDVGFSVNIIKRRLGCPNLILMFLLRLYESSFFFFLGLKYTNEHPLIGGENYIILNTQKHTDTSE